MKFGQNPIIGGCNKKISESSFQAIVPIRSLAGWRQERAYKPTNFQTIVVCASVGSFMLYFLVLREPNDIDEHIQRPIWVRKPGIDPEQAKCMMEMDHQMLGFKMDYEGLERYKEWYYSQDPSTFEQNNQNKPIKETFKRKSVG
ncbi:unnamed protein product [Meganyctiphanes norvegica]|uniref:Uncharacterized protein n=1 Tax=Meganyctiphanes norvegica TaxID=48144 RepID=A0AAV2QRF7_MEGNR